MGVEKQVNRRVADSRHDVQESFTVEHRLHEKSLPVVWRKEWGFCLLGQTMICGRIAIGRDRWELCSYATRFVLRLVTEWGDSMKRFLFTVAICLLVAAVTFACSICWSMTHVQVAVYDGEAALSLCGNTWIHGAE